MIWRNQIIMDTEEGELVLQTTYGYYNKTYGETLDYLFDTFGYLKNPKYPEMGAIRGHGEWVEE